MFLIWQSGLNALHNFSGSLSMPGYGFEDPAVPADDPESGDFRPRDYQNVGDGEQDHATNQEQRPVKRGQAQTDRSPR